MRQNGDAAAVFRETFQCVRTCASSEMILPEDGLRRSVFSLYGYRSDVLSSARHLIHLHRNIPGDVVRLPHLLCRESASAVRGSCKSSVLHDGHPERRCLFSAGTCSVRLRSRRGTGQSEITGQKGLDGNGEPVVPYVQQLTEVSTPGRSRIRRPKRARKWVSGRRPAFPRGTLGSFFLCLREPLPGGV